MVKFPLSLLMAGGVAVASAQSPALQGVKVRQVVIRAPSADVATAALEHGNDPSFPETLWRWVKEGKAQVISDLRKESAPGGASIEANSGRYVDWPSIRDQDFETLILKPTDWQSTFVGASMKIDAPTNPGAPREPRIAPHVPRSGSDPVDVNDWTEPLTWSAGYSPRDPVNVQWPIVWPRNKAPRVAWLEQPDFFREKIIAIAPQGRSGPGLLAIAPAADALEPGSPNKNSSDVILGEVESPNPATAEVDATRASMRLPTAQLVLVGIGIRDADALKLLQDRRIVADDGALLDELLKKVTTGTANLRLCCASATSVGNRTTVTSGREHTYPTEMPTIPSAWETATNGTDLLCEYLSPGYFSIVLRQSPAPPRTAEWPCAMDAPEMVMRQPQFFAQSMAASLRLVPETVTLLAALRTPGCLTGQAGLTPGETLLVFGKAHEVAPGPGRLEGYAGSPVTPKEQIEVESIIFDLPSTEEASWKAVRDGTAEQKRFDQLLSGVQEGRVRVASQFSTRFSAGERSRIESTEGFIELVDGEPDYLEVPGRYRPTAFGRHTIGATWEAEVVREADQPGKIRLNHVLQLDAQRPRHASLEEMIAYSKAHGDRGLPPMARFQETWESSLLLAEDTAHFIGLRHPPGDESKGRIHVAYVRARQVLPE